MCRIGLADAAVQLELRLDLIVLGAYGGCIKILDVCAGLIGYLRDANKWRAIA